MRQQSWFLDSHEELIGKISGLWREWWQAADTHKSHHETMRRDACVPFPTFVRNSLLTYEGVCESRELGEPNANHMPATTTEKAARNAYNRFQLHSGE